jgi:hypothetical protein
VLPSVLLFHSQGVYDLEDLQLEVGVMRCLQLAAIPRIYLAAPIFAACSFVQTYSRDRDARLANYSTGIFARYTANFVIATLSPTAYEG